MLFKYIYLRARIFLTFDNNIQFDTMHGISKNCGSDIWIEYEKYILL